MIRFAKFSLEEILPLIGQDAPKIQLAGRWVKMSSNRLRVFKERGVDCVSCGAKGSYFWLEKGNNEGDTVSHLNLYALDLHGKEVLMTRDHKIPVSQGGKDCLVNQHPMCTVCNHNKGFIMPDEIMFSEAAKLSVLAHEGQWRKERHGGVALPYFFHEIAVAKRVWGWGVHDIPTLNAAVTHDVLEDTKYTAEELEAVIGKEALAIVKELTFIPPKGISPDAKKALKAKYIETFAKASVEALVIKVADRIENVSDWLLTDVEYAKKYYGKGKPIFDAFVSRHLTVMTKFGPFVILQMGLDIANLAKKITEA